MIQYSMAIMVKLSILMMKLLRGIVVNGLRSRLEPGPNPNFISGPKNRPEKSTKVKISKCLFTSTSVNFCTYFLQTKFEDCVTKCSCLAEKKSKCWRCIYTNQCKLSFI